MDPGLTNYLIPLGAEKMGRPEPKHPSAFDMVSKVVLPIVLVLVAQWQGHRARWALFGFAALSFAAGYYPVAVEWGRRLAHDQKDRRSGSRALPGLGKLIRQFGKFVDPSGGATLHSIVQSEVCGSDPTRLKLLLPNISLFHNYWFNLSARARSQKTNLSNFNCTNAELYTLVWDYHNYCMYCVFEAMPQDLRSQLPDRTKSSLNAYRESFMAFVHDYERYLGGLDEKFAERHVRARNLPRLKPL